MKVGQGQFRQLVAAGDQPHDDAHRHHQKHRAKDGIELPDQLVDGQQRSQQVIDQNHHNPEAGVHPIRRQAGDQRGRAGGKHRAQQHQKDHREHPHHLLGRRAKACAYDFRNGRAVHPDGDHAAHVVMDGSAQNGAKHNPQKHHRAKNRSQQGSENGAGACDVKELNEKNPPGFHGNVVHPVGMGRSRRGPSVGTEDPFGQLAVEQVSSGQQKHGANQRYQKSFLPQMLLTNAFRWSQHCVRWHIHRRPGPWSF